ncbi:hypothetical protein D3C80_2071510 [compost metagenome]
MTNSDASPHKQTELQLRELLRREPAIRSCISSLLEAECSKALRAAATTDNELEVRRAQGEYRAYNKMLRILGADS